MHGFENQIAPFVNRSSKKVRIESWYRGILNPCFYMKMPPAFSSFMLVGFKGIRLFFFHILLKGGSIVREIVGCIHLSCLCR